MSSEPANRNLPARLADALHSRQLMLVVAALCTAFCFFVVVDAAKVRPDDGTVWLLGAARVLEVRDRPGYEPSPLRVNDRIEGIAGQMVRSPRDAADILSQQQIGSQVHYLVQRDGRAIDLQIELTPFRTADRDYIYNVILAFVYVLIGVWVYFQSRNDQSVRLFCRLCLLFGIYFVTDSAGSTYYLGDIITGNGGALARFLLPAFFLQFFLVFPERKQILARHPFLTPLLYVLPLMFYIQFTLDQFFGTSPARIGAIRWLVLSLYFFGGLAALLHSYYSFRDPLQKQRVRILTLGTLGGILPFLVFKVGLEEMWANTDLALVGLLPLMAIPVSFGYCVARYRLLQVELLLKRSLLYSLASGTLLLFYIAAVLGIDLLILRLCGPTSQLISVGCTLAVALALWPTRTHVQAIVDRKFYRSRDNIGELVQEFARDIPQLIHRDSLVNHIGTRLCEVIDLRTLGVYWRDGNDRSDWVLAGQIRRNTRDEAALPLPALRDFPDELDLPAISRIVEKRAEPFWVEYDPERGANAHQAITREQLDMQQRDSEQGRLAACGVELLVPLTTQGRLIGLFAIPARPGGEQFSLQDLSLLTIAAGQMALQLENSRLYEEEIEKQKLEKEMSLARTIQSRLLPGTIPRLPGIDLHAVNISSRQVSGDYFDMIQREDGKLGIVIADVSGKGVGASLLASNLQAAVRAICDSTTSPGDILGRLNRQFHASTDPAHFATIFLIVFDPETNRFSYSSGGHNAPVLVRADGGIELLEEGGLPLGAFDFGDFDEGTVEMRDGDLMFLYTDGLTETTDDTDEEFGTERMEDSLRRNQDRSAGEIIERITGELTSFSGRSEADDDITLIALKITATGETK